MSQTQAKKDPMIQFRTVMVGKNSKGGDRTQLYLNTQETTSLINSLKATLTNERGAKIDLHVSDKQHEGRTFKSAIAFVKDVQDPPGGAGRGGATSFKPKAVATAAPKTTKKASKVEVEYNEEE